MHEFKQRTDSVALLVDDYIETVCDRVRKRPMGQYGRVAIRAGAAADAPPDPNDLGGVSAKSICRGGAMRQLRLKRSRAGGMP